jgi:hypothetical protein
VKSDRFAVFAEHAEEAVDVADDIRPCATQLSTSWIGALLVHARKVRVDDTVPNQLAAALARSGATVAGNTTRLGVPLATETRESWGTRSGWDWMG